MKHIKVQDEPVVATPLPAPAIPGPNCGCILEAQGQATTYNETGDPVVWPHATWEVDRSVGGVFTPGSTSGEIIVPEYGTYLWMLKIQWTTMPSLVAGSSEGAMVNGRSYGGWYCEVSSDGWWADDIQALSFDPFYCNGTSTPSRTNEYAYSGIVMTSESSKSIYLQGGPDFNAYQLTRVHPLGYSEWSLYATLTLVSSLTGDTAEGMSG